MKKFVTFGSALLYGLAAVPPSTAQAQAGDSTMTAQAAHPVQPAMHASWTADRRRFTVGDIITVLVDERTIASADRMNYDARDRRSENRLRGNASSGGSSLGDAGVTLSSGSTANTEERGQARRSDRFAAEVSVRVVGIESGGVLKVEGTKALLIDKHEQTLELSGLVRPQDVSRDNVIDSWRMSDTRIAYVSNGAMGKPKRSLLGRVVDVIWP